MSQTSKVSTALRSQILNTLKGLPAGTKVSNQYFMTATQYAFSLRKIQEATQKLTREGLLTKTTNYGTVYYTLTPTNFITAPAMELAAAA